NCKFQIVLVGDHVTVLPKESLKNCQVDYILTGGNYDFLLLNLVNYLTKKEKLEPGIWSRTKKGFRSTGQFVLNQNLNLMPFIDRDLTKWQFYGYNNGNFKYRPGTYIMAGRDCWWRREGGCSFCSWTILYPKFATRTVDNVLDEIGVLIEKHGVREIFDDTGTFPVGSWLKEFCEKLIARGYQKKVVMGCNMRFGVLKKEDYQLLAKANFRFILYGVESANQKTVDRLTKGITIDKIEEELKILKTANREAGGQLEPHITCMIGYPWESQADAQKTVNLTKDFFNKDFKECEKNNWLLTKDWNKYDMSEPVMKTSIPVKDLKNLVSGIYSSRLTPGFIVKKLISIRGVDDFSFYLRGSLAALGHAFDFK
ncbi:radical SAM protein, partial [Candidatus Gottesmanbacteria bacterium]|nr:radical SAM protein [Candidatus Gottesmanbacteria bacterium]